jgi:regulator of protease activity HflC (stomatin/prohibitin superfamily)
MSASQLPSGRLGIKRALLGLTMAVTGAFLLAIIVGLAIAPGLGALILLAALIAASISLVHLIVAKSEAIRNREAVVWKGLAKIVSWNPTEGVIFLKNKKIDYIDDNPHDGGGIAIVYPLLGEELVLRVPLEIQTLAFRDEEVLTREYMPLTIQGTMYWRVSDLGRYYLNVSKEFHSSSNRGDHSISPPEQRGKFEVAELWLRTMAEEKTRTIVSRIGTGLLISDQLASDVPDAVPQLAAPRGAPQSSIGYRSAAEGLAETIKSDFGAVALEYGLEIHRVALQEVKLPPEIYAAAVDACKSSYLPLKAQAEAIERRLKLQAEADVIGKDAAGLKQIAGSIPALTFQEFLTPLFMDFNRRRGLVGLTDASGPDRPRIPTGGATN